MSQTIVTRLVNADINDVFSTVSNISEFSKAVPHIKNVEFLTDQTFGEGTKFRETRIMKGREASTILVVTEFVQNERIRLVSDSGGTIWDTVFTVSGENGMTRLNTVMEARPHKLIAKMVNPLIKGMVEKAIEGDVDLIKRYCESANHNACNLPAK